MRVANSNFLKAGLTALALTAGALGISGCTDKRETHVPVETVEAYHNVRDVTTQDTSYESCTVQFTENREVYETIIGSQEVDLESIMQTNKPMKVNAKTAYFKPQPDVFVVMYDLEDNGFNKNLDVVIMGYGHQTELGLSLDVPCLVYLRRDLMEKLGPRVLEEFSNEPGYKICSLEDMGPYERILQDWAKSNF